MVGPFDRFEGAVETWLDIPPSVTDGLLATATVFVAYFLVGRIVRRVVSRIVSDTSLRFQVNKALGYALGVIAFTVMLKIWIHGVTGLATYLGLLSAGLAIALQDPVANFAAWLFIIVRRPFGVGDRIQIGQQTGDVVDIRPFRFVMMEVGNWVKADQSTGRVIHVPNALIFKNPIANYDEAFGYIWNELEVTVSMESDWKAAKAELLRIVTEHAEHLTADVAERIRLAADSLHIRFGKLTPVVWTTVVDNGVRLTARYLCRPRERRGSSSEIWESVLEAFAGMPRVDFAYPTTRWFDHRAEGKPGAPVDGQGGPGGP
ncbi:MAG TPA: mechanosensitive ion channel family protein [Polyangiaceae bacterium]|jgi:small-conductance mechanosensitive channel